MAFWETKWKTHKVRSADVGKDYGIFQINSYKWCEDGTPGGKNLCKVNCAGEALQSEVNNSGTTPQNNVNTGHVYME